MILGIKSVKSLEKYMLHVIVDDGRDCLYDVGEDIENIKEYEDLKIIHGLFGQVQLDESRTCFSQNDFMDFPSGAIYEYGKVKEELHE